MKLWGYLEEKIWFILFQLCFIILVLTMFYFAGASASFISFSAFLTLGFLTLFIIADYHVKVRNNKKIHDLVDNLEEKYYVAEVIKKPRQISLEGYHYALKRACKAMNDKIGQLEQDKKDYQEYVESFAHEIKTPLSALGLYAENECDFRVKEELDKIDNLTEQMLYYARSENTEKDYFVKKILLEDLVHNVIMDYKNYLLKPGVKLNVHNLDKTVYTDEKWTLFIISQIIQNAVKYVNKKEKKIEIYASENENNVTLTIMDNGVGISKADLKRVFEKGFTGSNRNKKTATGMGLYLCKKLCIRLNLGISVQSEIKKFTKVTITFPKIELSQLFDN